MPPTLNNGDIVLVKKQPTHTGNGIYIIRHEDQMYVKRVIEENGIYILQSDNPQYNDIKTNNHTDFAIIGKVLWRGGEI